MFKFRKSLHACLLGISLVLAFSALLAPPADAWPRTVRIGVVAPLSDPYSELGTNFELGVRDLLEEQNARDGIHGHKFEILPKDSACEASAARGVAEELVRDSRVQVLFHMPCLDTVQALAHLKIPTIHAGRFLPNPETWFQDSYSIKIGINISDWRQTKEELENASFPITHCQPPNEVHSSSLSVVMCSGPVWNHLTRIGDPSLMEQLSALGIDPRHEQLNSLHYWRGISAAQVYIDAFEKSRMALEPGRSLEFFSKTRGRSVETVLGDIDFDKFGNAIQTELVLFTPNRDVYKKLLPYVLDSGSSVSSDLFTRGFERLGARGGDEDEDELTCCKRKCKKENGKETCKKGCTNCMVLRAW